MAHYLADDLGMIDRTPTGYAQATANESEPTPGDITQFTNALNHKRISMLIQPAGGQRNNQANHRRRQESRRADHRNQRTDAQQLQQSAGLDERPRQPSATPADKTSCTLPTAPAPPGAKRPTPPPEESGASLSATHAAHMTRTTTGWRGHHEVEDEQNRHDPDHRMCTSLACFLQVLMMQ